MVVVKDKAGSFLMHWWHTVLMVICLWLCAQMMHLPPLLHSTDPAGEQSGELGSSVGCWGAEWGAGEHKAGAGMSVELLVYNSYLYSCGKSVLLGSYSVHLRIKIGILIEYVVLLWIYVFYLRQFAFSCSSDLEGIVIA